MPNSVVLWLATAFTVAQAYNITTCFVNTSILPGLAAEYFSGTDFDVRLFEQVVPLIDFDLGYAAPAPGVPADYFSVSYAGYVRTTTAGAYRFRCDIVRVGYGSCTTFVNQTMVSDTDVIQLPENTNVRIKVELVQTSSVAGATLHWMTPNTSTFDVVESDALLHESVCPGGCMNGGCCAGLGVCQCAPGYGGLRCENDLNVSSRCSTNTTSTNTTLAEVTQNGLHAVYYADTTFTNIAHEQRDTHIDFDWGYSAPIAGMPSDFSVRWIGFVASNYTGWHTFYVTSSDAVRLLLGSTQANPLATPWTRGHPVFLVAGRMLSIQIDLVDVRSTAKVQLLWESDAFQRHVIESGSFYAFAGWAGCECGAGENNQMCSGRGGCALGTSTCVCDLIYTGETCEAYRCRADECRGSDTCYDEDRGHRVHGECGGLGVCNNGLCECNVGRSVSPFFNCVTDVCVDNDQCGVHGTCVDGDCECELGYMGLRCNANMASDSSLLPGYSKRLIDLGTNPNGTVVFASAVATVSFALPYYQSAWPGGPTDTYSVEWVSRLLLVNSTTLTCVATGGTCTFNNGRGEWRANATGVVDVIITFIASTNQNRAVSLSVGGLPISEVLGGAVHAVQCADGCGNGICVGDRRCACDYGYGGETCNETLRECVANNSVVQGAALWMFEDVQFTTLVGRESVSTMNWQWTSQSFEKSGPWIAMRLVAYLLVPHTGWYTVFVATGGKSQARVSIDNVLLNTYASNLESRVYLHAATPALLQIDCILNSPGVADSLVATLAPPNGNAGTILSNQLYHGRGECGCTDTCSQHVNLNPPTFIASSIVNLVVSESDNGVVRTVSAFDTDTGDGVGLQYVLEYPTTTPSNVFAFTIALASGELSVNGSLLSASLESVIEIAVIVTDGSWTKQATLSVVVCPFGFKSLACDTCAQGFGGAGCDRCQPCLQGVCGDRGLCECTNLWMGVACDVRCGSGWEGTNCTQHNCRDLPDATCNVVSGGGLCTGPNQCTCTPTFIGSTCNQCIPNHFGQSCEALSAVLQLIPRAGPEKGGISTTVLGVNFNSTSTYTCMFGSQLQRANAVFVSETAVACTVPPALLQDLLVSRTVNFELYENSVLIEYGESLDYVYEEACADDLCGSGICMGGVCFCFPRWIGANCTEELVAVTILQTTELKMLEQNAAKVRLRSQGTGPVTWAATTVVPLGLTLSVRGAFTWEHPVVGVYTVSVEVANSISRDTALIVIRVVPSYGVSITTATTSTQIVSGSMAIGTNSSTTTLVVNSASEIKFSGRAFATIPPNFSLVENDTSTTAWKEADVVLWMRSESTNKIARLPTQIDDLGVFVLGYRMPSTAAGVFVAGVSRSDVPVDESTPGEIRIESFAMLAESSMTVGPNVGIVTATALIKNLNPVSTIHNVSITLGSELQYYLEHLPNCSVPSTVAGGMTVKVTCVFNLPRQMRSNSYMYISSGEASSIRVGIAISVVVPRPSLLASPRSIAGSVARGSQSLFTVNISNVGSDTAQSLALSISGVYATLVSHDQIDFISPTGSVSVMFAITLPENASFGTEYGSLIVESIADQTKLVIGYRISVGSLLVANITVIPEDEYTYFAEGKPIVENAIVTITSYDKTVILTQKTEDVNATAITFTNIPAVYYTVKVEALGHSRFQNIVLLGEEGMVVKAFMQKQLISYTWTVTEEEIKERYAVTIDAVFQTRVPAPVITVSPNVLSVEALSNGQLKSITFNVTNHGLIRADDFQFTLPALDTVQFDWEGPIGNIPAMTSIYVVVDIVPRQRHKRNVGVNFHRTRRANCGSGGSAHWNYDCGGTKTSSTPITFNGGGTDCSYGSVRGGGGAWGGRGYTFAGGSTSANCDNGGKCRLRAAFDCLVGWIPGPLGCINCVSTLGGATVAQSGSCAITCVLMVAEAHPAIAITNNILGCILGFAQCAQRRRGLGAIDFIGSANQSTCSKDPMDVSLPEFWDCRIDLFEKELLREGGGAIASHVVKILRALNVARQRAEIDSLLFAGPSMVLETDGTLRTNDNALQWVGTNDTQWWGRFVEATADSSESGALITLAEISQYNLSVPLARSGRSLLNGSYVDNFISRWNNSKTLWDQGIVQKADLPLGSDTNFIPLDEFERGVSWLQDNVIDDPSEEASKAYSEMLAELDNEEEGICVTVRVRLEQNITLARTAFRGALQLQNGGSSPLTNISVTLMIWKADDTYLTDVQSSLFVVGEAETTFEGGVEGEGYLEGGQSSQVEWLFMALSDAAPNETTVYAVAGLLQYRVDGELETVALLPDYISVAPDAQLSIKYFWQEQVYADDPFTPDVEPSFPFSIAMMVHNFGNGVAKDYKVLSAQPRIVENEKGLLIAFRFVDSRLNFELRKDNSFEVAVGDLPPHRSAVAWWRLNSTLQGSFVNFTATVVYHNPLGDPRLSLVRNFTVHFLVRVVNDFMSDDSVPDFLTTDDNDIPNTLHSSWGNVELPVLACTPPDNTVSSNVRQFTEGGTMLTVNITTDLCDLRRNTWTYVRTRDPWGANDVMKLSMVHRDDGVAIDSNNFWRSYRIQRYASKPSEELAFIHIVDYNVAETYTLFFTFPRSQSPSMSPTRSPTVPTASSTTHAPSVSPTMSTPTFTPTMSTQSPTSQVPTGLPTLSTPTVTPTTAPTISTPNPSMSPTQSHTVPTASTTTRGTSISPTISTPTLTSTVSTQSPTSQVPTGIPTLSTPTVAPTMAPTISTPTSLPTTATPTLVPTAAHTAPTAFTRTLTPSTFPSLVPQSHTPSKTPSSSIPTRSPRSSSSLPSSIPTTSPVAPTPSSVPSVSIIATEMPPIDPNVNSQSGDSNSSFLASTTGIAVVVVVILVLVVGVIVGVVWRKQSQTTARRARLRLQHYDDHTTNSTFVGPPDGYIGSTTISINRRVEENEI
eukprot:m.246792 g.246792  ORF g.246792 m.246792 type:complete len:2910 (-) comp33851_c0_seq5:174-8903(-)